MAAILAVDALGRLASGGTPVFPIVGHGAAPMWYPRTATVARPHPPERLRPKPSHAPFGAPPSVPEERRL